MEKVPQSIQKLCFSDEKLTLRPRNRNYFLEELSPSTEGLHPLTDRSTRLRFPYFESHFLHRLSRNEYHRDGSLILEYKHVT